jgi:transposase InsO family protein
MNREHPLWGAPRIHGELLMLGIDVAESTTVGRYMVRRRRPPSQGWKTFLRNHAAGIASIDLFVVRTISFKLLYGLVILRHAHRRLVSIRVTNNPTAEWIAGQVTDAFLWDEAPRHLLRDRDGAFGPAYTHRIRAMRIRDHPTAPRSPWQNGHVERLIGSIRHESLDHLIVFDEAQLRRVLKNYASYYNQVRTHFSLDKNAPIFRRAQKLGPIAAILNPRRTPSSVRPGLGFDQAQIVIANARARPYSPFSIRPMDRCPVEAARRCPPEGIWYRQDRFG